MTFVEEVCAIIIALLIVDLIKWLVKTYMELP